MEKKGLEKAERSPSKTAVLQIPKHSKEWQALYIESFTGSAGINFLLILWSSTAVNEQYEENPSTQSPT